MVDKELSVDQDETTEDQNQSIFAERSQLFMNQFKSTCDTEKVVVAMAFVIDPQTGTPIIFTRGGTYEIAAQLANILRSLKHEIYRELDT